MAVLYTLVTTEQLTAIYDLMKWGPTSANSFPVMLAARALGLDCGPMSGFDNEGVDRAFFPGGHVKSNFLCAIGYGDPTGVFERLPRPAFAEVCSIV